MEKIGSTQICAATQGHGVEVNGRQRCGDLQRLLAAWPEEIADLSLAGRHRTVRRLERALRQERSRARAGHWAYDVARHHQLARLLRGEQLALQRCETCERLQQQAQKREDQKPKARL